LKQWERDVILSGMNAGDWDDWETESKASEVDTHTQAA